MQIRNATLDDLSQLIELKKPKTKVYRQKFAENQRNRLKEMTEGKAIYLVAENDNCIIGHLFLKFYGSQTQPDYPNIQDLYVVENQRRKGIGTKFIHEAEELVKKNGYTKVSLAVNPSLNPKAKTLYEKLGFTQTNTKPYIDGVYDGVEDWCVDMVKDLI